jgi:chorismate mutase
MRLIALRGATTVDANEADAILNATEELMGELLERNRLDGDSIVSCIFTLTPDLDAEFPAVAAREIPVAGALPRVIRVLMHCYPPVGVDPQHVYLGEARKLRLDLEGAQ